MSETDINCVDLDYDVCTYPRPPQDMSLEEQEDFWKGLEENANKGKDDKPQPY